MPAGRPSEYKDLPIATKQQYGVIAIMLMVNKEEERRVKTPCRYSEKQESEIESLGYTMEIDNDSIEEYPYMPTIIFNKINNG